MANMIIPRNFLSTFSNFCVTSENSATQFISLSKILQQLLTEPRRGQCFTVLLNQKRTTKAKSNSRSWECEKPNNSSKSISPYIILTDPPCCFITLSEKTKPRIPAASWSRKITVRQMQNCEEGKAHTQRERWLQHCKN